MHCRWNREDQSADDQQSGAVRCNCAGDVLGRPGHTKLPLLPSSEDGFR